MFNIYAIYKSQPFDMSSREEILLEDKLFIKEENAERYAEKRNKHYEVRNKRLKEKYNTDTDKYSIFFIVKPLKIIDNDEEDVKAYKNFSHKNPKSKYTREKTLYCRACEEITFQQQTYFPKNDNIKVNFCMQCGESFKYNWEE